MPSPLVRLYGRPDCHLCDEARAGLERLRGDGVFFELEEIDIESDDELFKRMLERIPVIELDGVELYDFFVDEGDLRSRLASIGPR